MYIGDCHGGERAYIYEENGRRRVFKPRPASTECAWNLFLRALSVLGMQNLPSAIIPISETEKGAIFDFIEGEITEPHEFFKRFGTLCAICSVMGAVDLHGENVLIGDNSPVICDLETLLPTAPHFKDSISMSTIISTGLVCNRRRIRFEGGSEICDLSALGSFGIDYNPYKTDILNAFETAYSFIISNKVNIYALSHLFADCRVRYLMRPTDIYYRVAAVAKSKHNPIEFITASLSRAYKNLPKLFLPALEYEIYALSEGFIPLFYCDACEKHLCADDKIIISSFFEKSPIICLSEHFLSVSDDSMRDDIKILHAALNFNEYYRASDEHELYKKLDNNLLSNGALIKRLYDENYETLIKTNVDLYSGAAGLLVLYSAIYKVEPTATLHQRIYKLLPVISDYHYQNIGFSDGIGGVITALRYAYTVMNDDIFIKSAVSILKNIEIIPSSSDFYNGAAGLCSALKLLRNYIGDTELIHIVKTLCEYMLENPVENIGFGHGRAGISTALAIASTMIGTSFDKEITESIADENMRFNLSFFNWMDSRGENIYIDGICSGTPGIAISRKIILSHTNNAQIAVLCSTDLSRAKLYMDTYKNIASKESNGSLCCGKCAIAEMSAITGMDKVKIDAPYESNALGLFDGMSGQLYASLLQKGIPPLFGLFI